MCIAILIISIIIILYIYPRRDNFKVESRLDNQHYDVLGGYDDREVAADRLAMINQKNGELIAYMVAKYRDRGTLGHTLATRMRERYRGDRLVENDPPDKHSTSYTEDKGEVLALCLREKTTGQDSLHDPSILEFVNLHELAHIASVGYGHDNEFWSNFAFILHEAKLAGVHQPVDYSKYPINYCGLDVEYNPYYDERATTGNF